VKRPLKPEETKVWGMVAATVRPLPARGASKAEAAKTAPKPDVAARIDPADVKPKIKPRKGAVEGIEPNRRHRIAREREEIGARLDLHGMVQERAKVALEAFIERAFHEGFRAVLVITGKGVQGDGVLRRAVPGWLATKHLSHMVAGFSEAARHHGGAGALYVALKRKP
jgi:DNA-nicking Smr family endonuclease